MLSGITHLKGERGAHQCQAEDTGINWWTLEVLDWF